MRERDHLLYEIHIDEVRAADTDEPLRVELCRQSVQAGTENVRFRGMEHDVVSRRLDPGEAGGLDQPAFRFQLPRPGPGDAADAFNGARKPSGSTGFNR